MENNNIEEVDPWIEVQRQFERIKKESGIEIDEDYQDELESLLGLNYDEMTKEMEKSFRTQKIKIELTDENATFPSYAYPTDSGFDLYSSQIIHIPPFDRALVPTGIRLSFDEGLEVQIRPKSGLALNRGLTVLNTPGTIDCGYNGEIKVIVFNTTNEIAKIQQGEKIAQAVLCPVVIGKYVQLEKVDKVDSRDRGDNGFGSTGTK